MTGCTFVSEDGHLRRLLKKELNTIALINFQLKITNEKADFNVSQTLKEFSVVEQSNTWREIITEQTEIIILLTVFD
jgi:hypothetical protein